MNFDDNAAEAAFRAEARAWIQNNAPVELHDELAGAGFGQMPLRSQDVLQAAKTWQKKKYDAGWACLHWPKEYGGRGATPIERVIWQQEEGVYAKLGGIFVIGHGLNIFMNILGSMVHPMRLTFVEFFKNSGYEGGGNAYKPFKK